MRARSANHTAALLGGVGVGATLMYFLDPNRGALRRALMRDRLEYALHLASVAAGATSRDLLRRARDVRDRTLGSRNGDHVAGDAADAATDGASTGSSPEQATNGRRRPAIEEEWTPAARLLTSIAGGALAIYGVGRRDKLGTALGLAGLALVTRGVANREFRNLVPARDGVLVKLAVHIAAPLEEVFDYLTDWEKTPSWLSHVRSVRTSGPRWAKGERLHWEIAGSNGEVLAWDAETTRFVPNEVIVWKSVPESPLRQAGRLRVARAGVDDTRLRLDLRYRPPADSEDDITIDLFDDDFEEQLDADVARLKNEIEAPRAARKTASASGAPDATMP
jgi:uncharacterized membrane protein